MKEKYLLLKAPVIKSKFEMQTFNISFVLFHMSIVFFINCLLFNNTTISKKYHNNGVIPFKDTILRCFLTFITSLVLYRIVYLLNYKANVFDTLNEEIKNDTYMRGKHMTALISKIRVKVIIGFLINFITVLFVLYYLTIFCIVYNNTQYDWVKEGIITIILTLVIYVVLSIVYAGIKRVAIRYKCEYLYNMMLLMKIIL